MSKSKPKPGSASDSAPAASAAPASAAPTAPATTRAYVDGREEGKARLLLADEQGNWQTFHLPTTALPTEAKEGSWIELSTRCIAAPAEFDSRNPRDKLVRGDDGKDFSL